MDDELPDDEMIPLMAKKLLHRIHADSALSDMSVEGKLERISTSILLTILLLLAVRRQ